jgi:hypothetical protein
MWTGGVAQAVECLLCKDEALSSNPNPIKKIIIKNKQCKKGWRHGSNGRAPA